MSEVNEQSLHEKIEAEAVDQLVTIKLQEQANTLYAEFEEEYERLSEKLRGAEERELQLSRQVERLNHQVELMAGDAQNESMRADELSKVIENQKSIIAEADKEIYGLNQRLNEVEQNRKNAANQLDEAQREIDRLNNQIDEMRRSSVFGERKPQTIIEVRPTKELYEQIKKETAAKYKVTARMGLYSEVSDEAGIKQVVHNSELEQMEIVDSFQYPEAPTLTEHDGGTIYESVSQSDMGDTGCEDQVDSLPDAEVSAELPSDAYEPAENPPQTAHSQETGETIYAPIGMMLHETHEEWVTRSINELRNAVFGNNVKEAA